MAKTNENWPAISRRRWRLLTLWIIAFTGATIYLIHEDRTRVSDIQQSRIHSCEITYRAIQAILFASTENQHLTPKAEIRFNYLVSLVDPNRCSSQIQP